MLLLLIIYYESFNTLKNSERLEILKEVHALVRLLRFSTSLFNQEYLVLHKMISKYINI